MDRRRAVFPAVGRMQRSPPRLVLRPGEGPLGPVDEHFPNFGQRGQEGGQVAPVACRPFGGHEGLQPRQQLAHARAGQRALGIGAGCARPVARPRVKRFSSFTKAAPSRPVSARIRRSSSSACSIESMPSLPPTPFSSRYYQSSLLAGSRILGVFWDSLDLAELRIRDQMVQGALTSWPGRSEGSGRTRTVRIWSKGWRRRRSPIQTNQ